MKNELDVKVFCDNIAIDNVLKDAKESFMFNSKVLFMSKIILTQICFPNTVKIDCNNVSINRHFRKACYSFTFPSKTVFLYINIRFSFPLSLVISVYKFTNNFNNKKLGNLETLNILVEISSYRCGRKCLELSIILKLTSVRLIVLCLKKSSAIK